MIFHLRFQLLFVTFAAVLGCAPQVTSPNVPAAVSNDAPISAEDFTEAAGRTSIFIGSDRYYIAAPSNSVRGYEVNSGPPTPSKDKIQKSSKQKVAPKTPPIDVDFILSKADISVGLASDTPQGRMQNDDVPFVPASITKVFTAAAALRNLGANFKFKTKFGFETDSAGRATRLLIFGDGDPTMGMGTIDGVRATRMSDIVSVLKSRGVREFNGSITFVSADPRVDDPFYASGISDLDARECYGAMSSTFNFNSNCSEVVIHAKNGFRWKGAGAGDFMTNTLETVASDRTSLSLVATFSADRILQGFVLRGSYAAKAPKTLQRQLPVANAVGWYAGELVKAMRENQIAVRRATVQIAKTQAERATAFAEFSRLGSNVATIESPPLSIVTAAMNKHSDNFLANSLFKALGSNHSSMGDELVWKEPLSVASQKSLRRELERWLKADGHSGWSNELAFYDGAGLSAENHATPRAFLAVLRQLTKEPTFPSLWDSLPIAGVDGTLGDRMKNSLAAGRVRGKTGTLTGSYQLVGFIPKVRGASVEYVPFVILTATSGRNRAIVRKFQDVLVSKMYETVSKQN